ncbi:amidase [Aureobasidium namibiae CBS 147.97]|uniref:amidase n=1 Tax=Aureobasidium namibiae CBS 147.97 TaxID=1043004 RepID=A0A074W702_9PEZI
MTSKADSKPGKTSSKIHATALGGLESIITQLPIIQTLPVPAGSADFEQKRALALEEFASKVPVEYRIPRHYIESPPKDVTPIPRECGILDDIELDITEQYDATALAHAIAAGKLTAVSVAKAFIKRSIICHQISNCLTQWMPELALKRAQELDNYFSRTGKTMGPLHGVPISVKQHIPLADTDSDMGFLATKAHNPQDSLLVAILRSLGAVFYCKTAQPQGIMHIETDGYHGRTLNPHNINLSPGGSSGGEAALIALRGSILGVGTDIGGSIRVPAGFVGIYGFKPTAYTLPMREFVNGAFPAELNILPSTGPMCTSLRDVDLFMHGILSQQPYIQDPRVVPLPWKGLGTDLQVSKTNRLKVGIMFNDGVVQLQPPVLRALLEAQKFLQVSPLVEIKPYKVPSIHEILGMTSKMYVPDGGHSVRQVCEISGEPLHHLTEFNLEGLEPVDAYGIAKLRVSRDAFRIAFSEDWAAQDVDVILSPLHVGPAAAHDTAKYLAYSALWNILDCPAIAFPTSTKVGKKGTEHYAAGDEKPWNELDAHVRALWEEHDYEGAPISLQLSARKHHDGMLIAALDMMRDVLELEQ